MLGEGRPLLRDGQGHGKAFGRCGRRSPDEPWDRKSGTVREVKVADYPGRRRGVPPLILLRMSAMMTCWCSIRLSLVQPRWVALKLGHRAATLDSNPEYTEEARARLGVTNIDQAAGGRLTSPKRIYNVKERVVARSNRCAPTRCKGMPPPLFCGNWSNRHRGSGMACACPFPRGDQTRTKATRSMDTSAV